MSLPDQSLSPPSNAAFDWLPPGQPDSPARGSPLPPPTHSIDLTAPWSPEASAADSGPEPPDWTFHGSADGCSPRTPAPTTPHQDGQQSDPSPLSVGASATLSDQQDPADHSPRLFGPWPADPYHFADSPLWSPSSVADSPDVSATWLPPTTAPDSPPSGRPAHDPRPRPRQLFPPPTISTPVLPSLPSFTDPTFILTMVNEGKLNAMKLLCLGDWLEQTRSDYCLVSEGALSQKSPIGLGDKHFFAGPVGQVRGGSAIVMKASLATHEVVLRQSNPDGAWSYAFLAVSITSAIFSVYINPSASATQVTDCLSHLTHDTGRYLSIALGGDLNANSGSPRRLNIDQWASAVGLTLENAGVITHVANSTHGGSNLDLLFTRLLSCTLITREQPQVGHARQVYTMTVCRPEGPSAPARLQPHWALLRQQEIRKKFVGAVELSVGRGLSLECGMTEAAADLLTTRRPRSYQVPAAHRRKISRLRKEMGIHVRGSPEFTRLVATAQAILSRCRRKDFRRLIGRLTTLSARTWSLHKSITSGSKGVCAPHVAADVATYYEAVYNDNTTFNPAWQVTPPDHDYNSAPVAALDRPFSSTEVRRAVTRLRWKKAPGPDLLPHDPYKTLADSDLLIDIICGRANYQLATGDVDPCFSRLAVIPKPGASGQLSDLRPLQMLNTSRKLLESLIMTRLKSLDGQLFHQEQVGFRAGRSAVDHVLTVSLLIADSNRLAKPLYLTAFDISKAFDKIPRPFISDRINRALAPRCPKLARLILALVNSPQTANYQNLQFRIRTGVAQGSLLSPFLFLLAMEELASILDHPSDGFRCEGEGGLLKSYLLYADDILIIDRDPTSHLRRASLVRDWISSWGGEVNERKTQALAINCPGPKLPVRYLGVLLSPKGVVPRTSTALFRTDSKARAGLAHANGLPPAVQLNIAKAVSWSALSYAYEAIPPAATLLGQLTKGWHLAARETLATFQTAASVEIARELGPCSTPLYWLSERIIRYYCNIFQANVASREPGYLDALRSLGPAAAVNLLLSPSLITWNDLQVEQEQILLRKHKLLFPRWFQQQLIDHTTLINPGVYDTRDPCWSPRLRQAPYLRHPLGRYAFMFNRRHLGPSNESPKDCFCCGERNMDTGLHLLTSCSYISTNHPGPVTITCLRGRQLAITLRAAEGMHEGLLPPLLLWMQRIYRARATCIPLAAHGIRGSKTPYKSDQRFLVPRQIPLRLGPPAPHPPPRYPPPPRPPHPLPPTPAASQTPPPPQSPHSPAAPRPGLPTLSVRSDQNRSSTSSPTTQQHGLTHPPLGRSPVRRHPPNPLAQWPRRKIQRTTDNTEITNPRHPPAPSSSMAPALSTCPSGPASPRPGHHPRLTSLSVSPHRTDAAQTAPLQSPRTPPTPQATAAAPSSHLAPAATRRTGRWTDLEDQALRDALASGIHPSRLTALSAAVETRTFSQIQSRLQSRAFNTLPPPSNNGPPTTIRRWTASDLAKLADAVNLYGYDCLQLSSHIPGRTGGAVRDKLELLTRSGQASQVNGVFRILPNTSISLRITTPGHTQTKGV